MNKPLVKKYYTVHQWQRLHYEIQRRLLRTYDVILTDHTTRREKILGTLSKLDITMPRGRKNWSQGIDKFVNGIDSFSKSMEKLSTDMSQIGKDPQKQAEMLWGHKKTFSL